MGFRKFYLLALCAVRLLLFLRLYGQQGDSYVWRPVRIVAGGYVPGTVAHPTEPGLIYGRTDIGSVYRLVPAIYLYGIAAPASVMTIYRSDDGGPRGPRS